MHRVKMEYKRKEPAPVFYMCKCTPEIKTPYCGKPGCQWPGPYLDVKLGPDGQPIRIPPTPPIMTKINPDNCTHSGYYVGYGFEIVQSPDGPFSLSGLVCMLCGTLFQIPQWVIVPPEKPKVAVVEDKLKS